MSKVIIISFSLNRGGAGIAAKKFSGLISNGNLPYCSDVISQDYADRFQFFKRLFSFFLSKFQIDCNPIKHSLNVFSYSEVVKNFKKYSNDIHHLHWINNDTLSIFDFNKIPTGSIITLHDEWLYCGAEHYYNVIDNSYDFISGYNFFKKGVYGLHLNYLVWKIKKNMLSHRDDLIYTVPSKWMLERALSSAILKKTDVRYLPNPINTDIFKPQSTNDINIFRLKHLIDDDDYVFCFGAIGGKNNFLKGAHLLKEAFSILWSSLSTDKVKKIKLIDFGGSVGIASLHGFHNISVGHIHDQHQLALLYSSVNCMVVPSIVEAFGQVAAESLACSTPIVCFDTSGLRDIVQHQENGLVAKTLTPDSLANQMLEMLNMSVESQVSMGNVARQHIINYFSYPVIAKEYLQILVDAENIKKRSFI